MHAHALLFISLPSVVASLDEAAHFIHDAVEVADRLTIALGIPGLGSAPESSLGSVTFSSVQALLSALYVTYTKHTVALGRPLAEVDIVFENWCGYQIGAGSDDVLPFDLLLASTLDVEKLRTLNQTRTHNGFKALPITFFQKLDSGRRLARPLLPESSLKRSVSSSSSVKEGQHDDVALGGTFDHLHAGHKILLSMTVWITRHRVVCGVTGESMLKSKKFKEQLEPIEVRITGVQNFLNTFRQGLVYEVVPIHDIYGPTITDSNLQALMVSLETLKGGEAVNQERVARNLPELDVEVIDLISPTETEVDATGLKISSTFIRQYLAEHSAAAAS